MEKFKDLTGQRFGRWTVLRFQRNDKGDPRWFCRCDCGTERLVSGSHLRLGLSTSCGCITAEKARNRGRDLSGTVFGHLTVKKKALAHSRDGAVWECSCDCGKQYLLSTKQLTNRGASSVCCNGKEPHDPKVIAMRKEMIGKRFGLLTVLYIHPSKNHRTFVHCRCDCGNECDIRMDVLKRQKSPSCGCKFKEMRRSTFDEKRENLIGRRFGKLVVESGFYRDKGHVWKCRCDCGETAEANTSELLNNRKLSCPKCTMSNGEAKINNLLSEYGIKFAYNAPYMNCRFPDTHYLAKFDFIVDDSYIIEYDGSQHFVGFWSDSSSGETLERRIWKDNYKNQFCFNHHIPIIRIPYTHYNDLHFEDLVPETSRFLLQPD